MLHTESVDPAETRMNRWSVPGWLIACGWVFTAAAAAWWWFAEGSADQLFIAVVALALFAVCACGTVLRPRLLADEDGVVVRGLRGTHRWQWRDVGVRVRRNRRLGRTISTLELEVPENSITGGLVVLTRLDLGEDPQDVAEALDARRPQRSPGS